MTDGDCVKQAIKDLGFQYEEHEIAQSLTGYGGDRRVQKAHIIIRRQHISSASNDIGFLKKEDGTYELIISEYDKRIAKGKKIISELKQHYGKHKFIKQAKKLGFSVKTQKVDSKGRIKIKVMGA